jgi:tRNA/tmRNA/rRNA uracil-C5-methylase (TrmA/RlmC/RlmD family)
VAAALDAGRWEALTGESRPSIGDLVEFVAGPVAHGGVCVARHDGRVVFVRHALPGERVRARLTELRSRYGRADAVEVLEPSPDRVTAPCPFAGPGRCGGCDWQHVSVAAQRELKAAVVAEQLRRLAGVDTTVHVEPVPGAPADGLGWRTRVSFAVGEGRAGLRRHRSHDIEPIDDCLIAHPRIRDLDVPGRLWPGAASVEAITSSTGERSVVIRSSAESGGVRIPQLPEGSSVVIDGARMKGRTYVTEQAAGRAWRVSGGGFWQVHPGAAGILVDAVMAEVRPGPRERALDLYAGIGLFAGAIAARVGPQGSVVAVESDRRAVADARRNLHDLPWVRLLQGSVDTSIPGEPVDVVVLDPPRSGAGEKVVRQIAGLGPRAVAYLACDPAALARDVATFAALGHVLHDMRAFDLFPMTHHVECVALLCPE